MNIPAELKYTKEHEWIRLDGNVATIGITDYAQGELGDIVFVELPNVGDKFEHMQAFGTIEAVKAVSDIYSPLSGTVTEINSALDDKPMVINSDPYEAGWMIKLEISNASELEQMLSADGYKELVG
ncbi:MAG: glycine cleavage system protein GcvH [bacterium]|nr:glycine cleavage system protein GcvH [bacterium]